jgi:transcriptional regulator with XRE-family HTH domain
MAVTNPLATHPDAPALRKRAGQYIKSLREKAEMSQNELAKAIGFEYYTMISQIELGKVRLPADRQLAAAEALKADPQEFVRSLLRFYDPYTWEILFGGKLKKAKVGA